MSKFNADVGLLYNSIDVLNSLKSCHDPDVLSVITSGEEAIKSVSAAHDNCLDSASPANITTFLNNVSTDIDTLMSSTNYAMDTSVNYSNEKVADFTYNGVDYKITEGIVTGNCIIPRSFYDPNIPLSDKISKYSLIDMYNNGQLNSAYSFEKYNKMLSDIAGYSTSQRDKAANIAIFMSTVYPRLPYLLGGGHYGVDDIYGIDSKWGTVIPAGSKGAYPVDNDEKNNVVKGTNNDGSVDRLYSLDCSGYVSWTLKNAGLSEAKSNYSYADFHYVNGFVNENLSNPGVCDRIRPGDLVQESGHIGIVVDKSKDYVVVSHVTGNTGMNLTKIDYNGVVLDDAMDKTYHADTNPVENKVFDRVIYVEYDDEEEKEKE